MTPAGSGAPAAAPSAGGREVAVLLGSKAAVQALALVKQSLLAYMLLPAGRGAYAVCVTFGSLAGIVVALGCGRSAQYYVMTRQLDVSQGVAAALAVCLLGGAAGMAAGAALIHSGLAFFQKADAGSFRAATLLIPLTAASFAMNMQLEGLKRFRSLAFSLLLQTAAVIAAVLVLVGWLGWGVDGAVLSLALGHLVMTGIAGADLVRNFGLSPAWPRPDALRKVLSLGLREYVAIIGNAVDERLGSLMLGGAAGRAEIGLFAVGHAVMTRAGIVPASVAVPLLPRVAERGGRDLELVAFAIRISFWSVAALLLGWIAVSPWLVPLLLSPAFSAVVPLTWIMSVGVLALSIDHTIVAYFRGTRRPGMFSLAIWGGLGTGLGLFLLLYPLWGLTGAAWAYSGGVVCRCCVLWLLFRRATGLSPAACLLLRRGDLRRVRRSARGLLRGPAAAGGAGRVPLGTREG